MRVPLGGALGARRTQEGAADFAYRIVARSVNNVHRGHVLIQEVAPDGNGIAATAIILFNGDTGCIAGTWGTETATPAEEKNYSLEERRGTWKRQILKWDAWSEVRERKRKPASHTRVILTAVISLICCSSCTKQHTTPISTSKAARGSDVVFLLSTRESYSAASLQGISPQEMHNPTPLQHASN